MHHFTPWTALAALAGGVLIGLAAVLLLWLNGRIAGVSGIVGGLWFGPRGDRLWRVLFVVGLALGCAAWFGLTGQTPPRRSGFPPGALLLAGLLVGYGTSLAGGCTSGHGVCGLARRSWRSLVATLCFLVAGIASTFVVRHLLGLG
ncbi:MAG: YeeE/YedE family protein [Rubrivivax sp.]|nr:YeeE/YedE family protein [Rubrivivax sp.]